MVTTLESEDLILTSSAQKNLAATKILFQLWRGMRQFSGNRAYHLLIYQQICLRELFRALLVSLSCQLGLALSWLRASAGRFPPSDWPVDPRPRHALPGAGPLLIDVRGASSTGRWAWAVEERQLTANIRAR